MDTLKCLLGIGIWLCRLLVCCCSRGLREGLWGLTAAAWVVGVAYACACGACYVWWCVEA